VKNLIFGLVFAAVVGFYGIANALSLQWDTVSVDSQGVPLGSGMQVTSYKVYKCSSPSSSCLKGSATVIGTVTAPSPQPATLALSITSQPVPSTYFVTAVNIINESVESDSLKATGADKPKSLIFIQP
jgi:hypothetical protein